LEGLKNEFVSMVSHELRTPLTSILGSLGLLMGGVAGEMSAQAKVMLDIAQKNGGRLLRLINDLLDMEKIESGKMEFRLREVPLCDILAQALDANRAFAQGYHVKLRRAWVDDPSLLVYVDPERVLQVLANLLSNAIKFSPHGGSVEIDLAVEGEAARVAIRDQGEGISLAFQGRIFEKFAQADASNTRKKGGTGLGLSIAKAIVERLQGDIGFETQLGKGTTFFFSLPLIKKRDHASAKTNRVLICEDDAEVAFLLHRLLEQSGFYAKIVSSPDEALSALQQESFDAMTLDLHLAEDSGMRFLRQMRGDPALKELPVVIVSALSIQEESRIESQALGVFDWLQKPFKPQRLIESLRRLCGLAVEERGAP
jgi:CheY-like chemotaxis protein